MRYLMIVLLTLLALAARAVVSENNNFGNYQQPTGGLAVTVFYDVNTNGAADTGEGALNSWRVTITNTATGQATVTTTPVAQTGLAAGAVYVVTAALPTEKNWKATTPLSREVTIVAGETAAVRFGMVALGAGGGKNLQYWIGKNGQKLIGADDVVAVDTLTLRDAAGNLFHPSSKTALVTWLKGAGTKNMAYALSAQNAVMKLNIVNGLVDGSRLIVAAGANAANPAGFATVNAVMTETDAELGLHGLTKTGSPYRAYQTTLQAVLSNANATTAVFVLPEPAVYSFTTRKNSP